MTETASENYRWAAHTGGPCTVRGRDYLQDAEEIEAETPYEAWKRLRSDGRALKPGDLLEPLDSAAGTPPVLLITKYIGFEPAAWFVPSMKPDTIPEEITTGDLVSGEKGSK